MRLNSEHHQMLAQSNLFGLVSQVWSNRVSVFVQLWDHTVQRKNAAVHRSPGRTVNWRKDTLLNRYRDNPIGTWVRPGSVIFIHILSREIFYIIKCTAFGNILVVFCNTTHFIVLYICNLQFIVCLEPRGESKTAVKLCGIDQQRPFQTKSFLLLLLCTVLLWSKTSSIV